MIGRPGPYPDIDAPSATPSTAKSPFIVEASGRSPDRGHNHVCLGRRCLRRPAHHRSQIRDGSVISSGATGCHGPVGAGLDGGGGEVPPADLANLGVPAQDCEASAQTWFVVHLDGAV